MSESSLSLAYYDFLGDVGAYLGYGRGDLGDNTDTAWDTTQNTNVTRAVAAGQRQFYTPPPLEGERFAHEWSFLKPTGSVALADGESSIDLPDDFGGFDGPVTITASGTTVSGVLTLMGEALVRQAQAENASTTGQPQMVALVPVKGVSVNKGQRFQLLVWPAADDDYTLSFPYILLPEAVTGARPYAYGGAQHVETVLASCLERAEFYRDNQRGVCWANWMDRLAASVSIDRRNRPVCLGRNRDDSDNGLTGRGATDYWQTVTYYGATP